MNSADRYRIDHGLCPECGKEAAPYYLCTNHRQLGSLTRLLNKMADRSIIQKLDGGRYAIPHGWNGRNIDDFAWGDTLFDMKPDDKRLRPRMGRRPIDLDETLMSIFFEAGSPLQMEEIYAAWGKLRSQRKHASLAGDMTAIIAAQRRREMRDAKRAKVVRS